MKRTSFVIGYLFLFVSESFAYDPPGPGGDPSGDPSNDPIGGGSAPIEEGWWILLVAAILYFGWKTYKRRLASFEMK